MNLRQTCALSLLSLAACGGGSISQSDLPAKYAVAACQKILACCSGTSGAPTEANCEAKTTALLQASIASGLGNPHRTYNADAGSACISEINAMACEDLATDEHTPDCDLITVGTVANGGACTQAEDCASALCTNIPNGGGNGTCAAKVSAGQNCPSNVGTAYGDYCNPGSYETNPNNVCICAAAQANGASCGSNEQCTSGYCDDGNTHTCIAYPNPATLPSSNCTTIFSIF